MYLQVSGDPVVTISTTLYPAATRVNLCAGRLRGGTRNAGSWWPGTRGALLRRTCSLGEPRPSDREPHAGENFWHLLWQVNELFGKNGWECLRN